MTTSPPPAPGSAPSQPEGRIVGRRPASRPLNRKWAAAFVVVGAFYVGYLALHHRWSSFVLFGGLLLLNLGLRMRPLSVVDATGIRRAWRRRSRIEWTAVESVVAPQPGVYSVRLTLEDGHQVVLDDIPSDRAGAVAAIGGKPVRRATVSPTPAAPGRRPAGQQERSYAELEADVARRAARLAEQRAELERRNPRRDTPEA